MTQEIFTQLAQSLIDGDPDATVDLTKKALADGVEPMAIIREGLMPGMNVVGDKFGCGEYYLPDLIIAADGMQQAMALLEPELRLRNQEVESAGTMVLGTVKGDIHEIGKTLVMTMLSASGFQVHDLGVDVAPERFVAKAREVHADLVGLSALLTTTMPGQRLVIEALDRDGLRPRVKVMVGGAPVSHAWAETIGADGYGEDAAAAVTLARRLVGRPVA